MFNFVFGGFLPGTNIQVSFTAWAVGMLFLLILGLKLKGITKKSFFLASNEGLAFRQGNWQIRTFSFKLNVSSLNKPLAHQVWLFVSQNWFVHKVRLVLLEIIYGDWT